MSLNTVLENFQRNVPGCISVGVVDIGTDTDIGTTDDHPKKVTGRMVATTSELVRGQDVVAIEDMFTRIRGTGADQPHHFQEIVIFSDNHLHVFQRCKRDPNKVLRTICRKETSLGLVMIKSRDMRDVIDLAI